jgi:hypothetical protein
MPARIVSFSFLMKEGLVFNQPSYAYGLSEACLFHRRCSRDTRISTSIPALHHFQESLSLSFCRK